MSHDSAVQSGSRINVRERDSSKGERDAHLVCSLAVVCRLSLVISSQMVVTRKRDKASEIPVAFTSIHRGHDLIIRLVGSLLRRLPLLGLTLQSGSEGR
jgi:hypothetical protein